MHTSSSIFILEIVFTTYFILWTAPLVELACAGLDSPFDILPESDPIIEYDSVLELYCKLNRSHPNATGHDARDLYFYQLEADRRVILPNVTVLNDTTIKIDLVSPPLGSTYYYCSLNDTFHCFTIVTVGFKPQPVLNFQCTSYNWERLYCHWTPPENPIKTEYKLNFTLPGRAGITPRPCPNQLDVTNNSCIYDHDTKPFYRQSVDKYFFEIIGKNALGNISQTHTFHHYKHVIPNKPENVTVVNKTVGSVVLAWNIPYPVFHFPPGLRSKIEYKNKWENWVEIENPNRIYGFNYTFNITGLKYSHTPYDVRVYLKSFIARPGPNEWSEPSSITFVTPSTIPSMSPKTTQGIFDVVSSGNDTDVFIYWKRIPEESENGYNFSYNVVCTKDNSKDCGPPIEKSISFAKFPFSGIHSYSFSIYSVNEVGRSVDNSYVFVKKYNGMIKPESFTRVAYDQGVFELSWKPVAHKDLSHYTIFWCREDKDLPVPCKGYLDWTVVQKDATSKNITMSDVTKFYKFAIAANLNDGSSSGMVWSACVIFHDKVLKIVDDFHISRVGSREVDVVWEIRCAQSSAFKGFVFYYCPVNSSVQDNNCTGNVIEETRELNGSQERNVTLTHLKPYTTYKLQISIISLDGSHQIQLGPRSIPKRFITLEDAPSVPLNLSSNFVTNTSIMLTWILPKEMNGLLERYILNIDYPGGRRESKFDAQNVSDNSIVNTHLVRDLMSFTTYNFTLKVCTSTGKCSDDSEPAVVTTLIGTPGKMMRPQISIINSSADVSWEFPVPSSGHLDYYQLLVLEDEGSTENEIFNLIGSSAKLSIQACKVKYKVVEFKIRAINVDNNNNTLFGPWSESTQVHCGSSIRAENAVLIDWLLGTFSVLIFSVGVFYIAKKGWLQCRKMKDVEVKLPPGLQSQDLEKDNQDYLHLERWPPRSPDTVTGSTGPILAPDEESLLDKKSDESMDITPITMPVTNGGDSSGCSAGRESVSSSITSDTHISSDSGAEADQCVTTPNAFEQWNTVRKNTNNINFTNSSKDVLNFSDFGDWDLSESTIPGYTKVGLTNCFVPEKNLPEKGYVTFSSVTPSNPSPKNNNLSTGNAFTTSNLIPLAENSSFSSDSGSNNVNMKNQSSSLAPKYVSLAHFEGQKKRESSIPKNMFNGARSVTIEPPRLSRLEESSERDDEKTENSIDGDFSGNETETETIHEVPISRNMAVMPPYVSMMDNPESKTSDTDEDEKINGEENDRLSLKFNDLANIKTVNGIDSAIGDNASKESESFSNYIPHHMLGNGSVHT